MFLTPDHVAELTGRKRTRGQIAWLREHGWRFEINAAGRPVVLIAEMERHLLGNAKQTKIVTEPRFDVLR